MGIVSITDNSNYSGYYPVYSNLTQNITSQSVHTGTRSYTTTFNYTTSTTTENTASNAETTYRTQYTVSTGTSINISVYPYRTTKLSASRESWYDTISSKVSDYTVVYSRNIDRRFYITETRNSTYEVFRVSNGVSNMYTTAGRISVIMTREWNSADTAVETLSNISNFSDNISIGLTGWFISSVDSNGFTTVKSGTTDGYTVSHSIYENGNFVYSYEKDLSFTNNGNILKYTSTADYRYKTESGSNDDYDSGFKSYNYNKDIIYQASSAIDVYTSFLQTSKSTRESWYDTQTSKSSSYLSFDTTRYVNPRGLESLVFTD